MYMCNTRNGNVGLEEKYSEWWRRESYAYNTGSFNTGSNLSYIKYVF